MDDPTIPGLTGALDYQPERREEGIAFTLYPADTSEPLAYILRGPGAEQITRRMVQCVNAHDDLVTALQDVHTALSAAWSARTLPASVIPASLAQKCSAALAKAGTAS